MCRMLREDLGIDSDSIADKIKQNERKREFRFGKENRMKERLDVLMVKTEPGRVQGKGQGD